MRSEISRLQRDVGVTTIYVTHDQVEAMTMGDRVAVLKGGYLQQVDAPNQLYRRPTNLFVAGFIGSPAMNFVEADLSQSENGDMWVEFGGRRLQLDPATLEIRPKLPAYAGRRVIVGVRPQDMEDASLVSGAPANQRMQSVVDLREDMGSEVLIHFTVDAPPVLTEDTKELAADQAVEITDLLEAVEERKTTFVARFDPDTKAQEGDRIEIHFDTRAMHFFDPETARSIWDED
jgi:multiple sugar transport system ATP-binding protein